MLRKLASAVVGLSLLASMAVVGAAPQLASAALITSDDFTSGTLAAWSTVTRATIDNAIGSPAAPSANLTAAAQSAVVASNLTTPVSSICMSANINVASGNNFDLLRLRTAANGPLIKAFLASNGALGLRSDFAGTSTTTAVQLGAGWHNIELCGTVGAANAWTLYRDGVQVTAWTANTGTDPVGRVQFGDTAAKTFTANFDHVVVDQAPGDETGGPADTTAPTVPGTPTGTSTAPGSIALTWAASTDPSTPISYRIFRDGSATALATTPTTNSFTDTGLAAGSSHTYAIVAVDAAGNASAASPTSASITVMTPADTTAPTVPGVATGSSTAPGSIALTWTASTDPSTPITYRIYRDGSATALPTTTTTNSFTDTGLAAGSSHTYRIDAVDAVGNASTRSAASASITVQSVADTTAPTVPGTPTGTSPSSSSIQIGWTASTDASAPITYRIYRDGGATAVGTTTTLSFTDTGLAAGSSHTYTVDAIDPALNASAKSASSASIVVQTAPPSGSIVDEFANFNGWSSNTRLTISTTAGSPAAPSARAQTTNQSAFAVRTLPTTRSQACVSVNVNIVTTNLAVDVFRLRTAANTQLIRVTRAANGTLQMRNDLNAATQTTTTQLGTGWHNVELCGTVGAATSWTLYRDGVLINTWATNTGTTPIGLIQLGDTVAKTFTANYDHFVVDSAPGDAGAGDTTAPTVPGRPAGTSPSTSSIQISWTASTDASSPITYRIYRDGGAAPIGTTTTLSFTDTGLAAGSTHTYTVDAIDPALNASAKSQASLNIVVQNVPDTTAPTVPGRPAGTSPAAGSIQIGWTASTDASSPITYRIYRDGSVTAIGQTTTLSFTDTGLAAGSNHTYTVDAIDPALNASAKSQASLTITVQSPAAGLQPKPGHTRIANDVVSTNMPRITAGEIWDIEYIGNKVYVAGGFTNLRNNTSNNTTVVNQAYLASFDITTGLIDTAFNPVFDQGVTEIEASPDGTKLFVVGRFNSVNGATKRKIASINPTNGDTNTGFTAQANAAATSVDASNTVVYVGGQFTDINGSPRVGLAALNATTGAVVTGFQNDLAGGVGVNGALSTQALKLTHDGTKLLVVHTGTTVAGQTRMGMALINTLDNQLLPWRSRLWDDNLQFVGGITRIYAGDIAPNDQYFVVSSGSGGDRPPISDTIIAYPIDGGDDVQPMWISRAFDSVYSLAVTEQTIYIGGHFNYNESPTAPDPWPGLTDVGYGRGQGLAGYGLGDDIVLRDHVGALSPVDGKAMEWNPGSNSFEGNKAMIAMPRGIVAGGDATTQGEANVGRIAFYDFNAIPTPNAYETTIVNPIEGRVEEAGVPFTIEGNARTTTSTVLRVQVEIRDRDTNRYLNDDLTTWAANGVGNTINATLATPASTNTNWSLTLSIPENRRLMIYARTVATNGSQDNSKAIKRIETFGLADETPTTSISGPSGSVIPTTTFLVNGTASDDLGVNSITLTMRDVQNRYLQANGTVSPTYATFRVTPDVVGATSATWSREFTVPYEGQWTMQAIAVDTSGQSDLRSADRTWLVSDTAVAPTVTVDTPAAVTPPATATITLAPGSPVTFSGTATDDEGLDYVAISLRNTSTGENLSAGGAWGINEIAGAHRISGNNSISGTTYNWSYTTPFNLTSGTYSFLVGAIDDLGISTSSSNQGRITINVQVPGDAFPNATITPGGTVNGVQVLHLDLAGSATDDIGVSSVRVAIEERESGRFLQANGSLAAAFASTPAVLASPNATSTNWTLSVNLPIEGDYSVTAIAFDTSQQQDPSTSGATSRYPIYPGDTPPTVTENLLAPANGDVFTTGKIFVSGRLEDDQSIAEGEVAIRNGAGQYMNGSGQFTSTSASWREAFLNSPGSPGSNFSYTSPTIPAGSYTVLVRGIDQHNFVTPVPIQRTVTVEGTINNQPPVANFTYTCNQNVCNFDGRTSTDEATPTLTYSWSFGSNQGSGSGPVPNRTYTAAGSYTVTLTVRDENNLTGVTSKVLTMVEPAGNSAPAAVIASSSCTARTCVFSSTGSTDPNTGDSVSLAWNFGDTGTSTSSSPSRTYAADGTYTVTLTATDGWGKSSTATTTVTITEPAGNLPPVPVISNPVCVVRTCNFFAPNSSDPDNDAFTYAWNFGDTGTSTSSAPTRTYAADGSYTVTLTLTDIWGNVSSPVGSITVTIAEPGDNQPPNPVIGTPNCVARTCSLSSAGSSDPNGNSFTYLWNFGDATATSTASAPSHTFPGVGPYTITLTLTDAWGDANSVTRDISFTEPVGNTAPTPVIDTPVCTARSCTVTASTSSDPQGDAFTYLWSFADTPAATTSTSATATKTWAADGTYTVTLTLTDVWGKSNFVTRDITITKPASNVAPTPVISTPVCNARVCSVPGVSSSDPNGDAFTYLWSWVDITTTGTSSSISRTFTVDGTYTVRLRVTDAWGDFLETTRDIVIAEPGDNVAPNAVIGTPSCAGRVCTFSSAASSDPNGNTFTYIWAWGDGTTNSTTANPSHTFALAGTYTVTLTLTDGWGKIGTITRDVTVA